MRHLVLALLVLSLPSAMAQSHEHAAGEGPMAFVLHDGPDNGRAVVGGYTHFGFALLDETGRPVAHNDAEITLTQGGVVLFHSASTHEYDGLFSLDYTFTQPGPYEVTVASGEFATGTFVGEAVAPVNATQARIEVDQRVVEPSSNLVEFTVRIVDASGALLPHTDAILELRKATGDLVTRVHAHIHDEPIVYAQRVVPGSGHSLHVTAFNAFPTGNRPDFRAVVAQFPVTESGLGAPGVPMPFDAANALDPSGASAEADGFTLHGMVDPQRAIGLGGVVRLTAVIVDANATPVPHVDFDLLVEGPLGIVARTASLHEYDGMLEWTHAPAAPGLYRATVLAKRGDIELAIPYEFQVLPPAVPLDAGRYMPVLEGADDLAARETRTLTFALVDAAGRALPHAEVDVTVFHEEEAPIYQFKIHAHDDGRMSADLAFPHDGAWKVRVDPIVLLPQAAVATPAVFDIDVAEGLPIAPLSEAGPDGAMPLSVPGPESVLLLVAFAAVALAARRRL